MLKVINKDILTVEAGIICHQVNCQGVMGSGIAKSIRDKWPIVYESYLSWCKLGKPSDLLGNLMIVPVAKDLRIANIFGQYNYGRSSLQYTDYFAVEKAFKELCTWNLGKVNKVYIPFNMGCGLANGKWETYEPIIEKYIPSAIVCKL